MNAIYGFGARRSASCVHGPSRTITFCGRQMLLHTQRHIFAATAAAAVLPGDAGARDERGAATRRARSRGPPHRRHRSEHRIRRHRLRLRQESRRPTARAGREQQLACVQVRGAAAAATTASCARSTARQHRSALELEFEKVLFPLVCYSKKRYAYLKHVELGRPGAIGAMGLQLVRRDLCSLSTSLMWRTIEAVLRDSDPARARALVVDALEQLCQRQVPIHELSCSKTLRSGGSAAARCPRTPTPPRAYDAWAGRTGRGRPRRLPDRQPDKRLHSERRDDPAYVEEHGVPIDYVATVQRQLRTLVCSLFAPVLPELPALFDAHTDCPQSCSYCRAQATAAQPHHRLLHVRAIGQPADHPLCCVSVSGPP